MSEIIPIVVVNWNRSNLLKSCLESLLDMNDECEKAGIEARVIIVDNASSDTSFSVTNHFVEMGSPNIHFVPIWKESESHFVAANNLGIKHALTLSVSQLLSPFILIPATSAGVLPYSRNVSLM
jgi:GT2 family glycosyltransferase